MGMMDKLKKLFLGANLPEETREVFEKATSAKELLAGLEGLLGKNEMELREKEEHQEVLEKALRQEEEQIRSGALSQAQEMNALRRIARLEKQKGGLDNLVFIYNKNVNLHLNLIAKIQELEAMRFKGVQEEQIDMVMEEMATARERDMRDHLAGEDADRDTRTTERTEEQQRLEAIKKRVLGSPIRESAGTVQRKRDSMEAE